MDDAGLRKGTFRAAVLGALTGGAVGVALGLLIAPERGERARRRLAYQLDHMASRVGTFVEHLGEAEEYSEARRSGAEVVDEAKAQAEQILKDADTLLKEVKRHRNIHGESPEERSKEG